MYGLNQLAAVVLAVAATAAAAVFAVLKEIGPLQDALIGVGIGAFCARIVIWRHERKWGELPSRDIRRIELLWTFVGVAFALGAYAVSEIR